MAGNALLSGGYLLTNPSSRIVHISELLYNYMKYQNLMMRNLFYLAAALLIMVSGCGSPALDNFNDIRYDLTNHDTEPVAYTDHSRGIPAVIGFIDTNCPDICSFITATNGKVRDEIPNPESAHFVLVTFDPERDTPEVLKNYANAFGYTGPEFQFLTGEPDVIDEMMERVGVRLQESYTSELESGEVIYFLSHSDKIMLIDQKSRLIFDYGGSMTPPAMIIEDLDKL